MEVSYMRMILRTSDILRNQLICFCSIKIKSPMDMTVLSNYSLHPQSSALTKCFPLSFRRKRLWRVLWNFPGLNVWKLWEVTSSFPVSINILSRWVCLLTILIEISLHYYSYSLLLRYFLCCHFSEFHHIVTVFFLIITVCGFQQKQFSSQMALKEWIIQTPVCR